MSRLPSGGLIDRSRPLNFTFDGHRHSGFAGDTLASALVANDVRLVARSFKYHRPRGILTAGPEEPNALVTIGTGADADPNARATTVPLTDGLVASSQNRWPSLSFDLMAVNGRFSPIFVAGFYYKTFMWPAALWEKLYEPLIRRAAGLGRLSGEADPARYDRDHLFCDLLVVGAGPAGLAAALTAGRAGARVLIVDGDAEAGGRLLAERHLVDGQPGAEWAAATVAELASCPSVTMLRRTTLFGAYDGGTYGAVEELDAGPFRQRLWKIRARHAIVAAGAIERPLVFGGNDRPGVMTASAIQTYVNRFAAAPGARVALFVTTDSGHQVARDLAEAGVEVAAIVDGRADAPPPPGLDAPFFAGGTVVGTRGKLLREIEVRDAGGRTHRIACDALGSSGGWNPAMGIASNLGARPVWSERIHSFLLETPPAGIRLAGAAAGTFTTGGALAEGTRVAADVLSDLGLTTTAEAPRADEEAAGVAPFWYVGGSKQKAFVDLQHDVTDADIELSAREGFTSVEHLKRYTTLGMATDQGKTSQVNGHALLALHANKSIAEAGTVLSRPPYLPIPIGVLAGSHRGEHFRPVRHVAAHAVAVAQGATFVDVGQWKRAQWFTAPGEADWMTSVNREVRMVRESVGICDVSTLGKIEIVGPDAGALLDRLYANTFSTLAVGRVRYGLMLREDGFVLDDGTVTRLAPDRWFMTTTTANAARVMQHIEFARQVLWPELDVQTVSVTEQWAQFAVAGPRSRALLQRLLPDHDLSNAALPYMAAAALKWRGLPARLFRVSFSGELAYEMAVPADYGAAFLEALLEAGAPDGAGLYGTEALGVMRIEKGHPAGNELSGQTTAGDLGLAKMLSTKKDFIGRVMAGRPGLADPMRPCLVGLRPVAAGQRLRGGAHLIGIGDNATAANDQGYITSVAYSPTLDHWIGLGLLADGCNRTGERLRAHDPVRSADIVVEVCNPIFFDPEGERLRG
jgi:sarcosine oxidase subunit alpha